LTEGGGGAAGGTTRHKSQPGLQAGMMMDDDVKMGGEPSPASQPPHLVCISTSPFMVPHILPLMIILKVVLTEGEVTVDTIPLGITIADSTGRKPSTITTSPPPSPHKNDE